MILPISITVVVVVVVLLIVTLKKKTESPPLKENPIMSQVISDYKILKEGQYNTLDFKSIVSGNTVLGLTQSGDLAIYVNNQLIWISTSHLGAKSIFIHNGIITLDNGRWTSAYLLQQPLSKDESYNLVLQPNGRLVVVEQSSQNIVSVLVDGMKMKALSNNEFRGTEQLGYCFYEITPNGNFVISVLVGPSNSDNPLAFTGKYPIYSSDSINANALIFKNGILCLVDTMGSIVKTLNSSKIEKIQQLYFTANGMIITIDSYGIQNKVLDISDQYSLILKNILEK